MAANGPLRQAAERRGLRACARRVNAGHGSARRRSRVLPRPGWCHLQPRQRGGPFLRRELSEV